MDNIISTAVKRLDAVLPLVAGLKSVGRDDATLYCKLLNSYARTGRALSRYETAAQVSHAQRSLANLAGHKLIVLDAEGNPTGVYPFTSEQREHKVHINDITVHCMCALDALAVSPMFEQPTVIDSQCRVSGNPVHIEQHGTDILAGTTEAWFGIDWGAANSGSVCAESLCMEMIFLINAPTAREWLTTSPDSREIFELTAAIGFAAEFFVPLAKQCREYC